MKLYSIFAIFVISVELKTISGGVGNKALQAAFAGIKNFLAERNHLVSVVAFENVISDSSKAVIIETMREIPHRVLHIRTDSTRVFQLNSSAIVSIFSTA